MKAKFILFVCTVLFILVCNSAFSQIAGQDAEIKQLSKIISKNLTPPKEVKEDKRSVMFSLKIKMSEGNKVEEVIVSKRTPKEIGDKILNKEIYSSVDWKKIFNRNTNDSDVLILPVVMYPLEVFESVPSFTYIDVSSQFDFKDNSGAINCMFIPTLSMPYGTSRKK